MLLKQQEKIRVNFDDLVQANNTADELLGYNEELFTGYAVLGYHSNGNVESEEEFRNGITMGWIKSKIKQSNKYITETKIYNDNMLISTIHENYISSDFSSIKQKFNNNVPN